MLPSTFLREAALLLSDDKLPKYFSEFVESQLVQEWTAQLETVEGLLEFRDMAESAWADVCTKVGKKGQAPENAFEKLVKVLKTTPDASKRKKLTVAFLHDNVKLLKISESSKDLSFTKFIYFCICQELEAYFQTAASIRKFRPLMQASRDTVESVLKDMDLKKDTLSLQHINDYATKLGTTVWPVMAMWKAHRDNDADSWFINTPMPRVFGNPSCIRNAIERNCNPLKLSKPCKTSLDLANVVLCSPGQIAYRESPEKPFTVAKAPRAHLVANLPGLSRYIWVLRPETLEAAIYCLRPFRQIVEFDLPKHDDEVPNWIDCQRDVEGSLVLAWGHINSLTGMLQTQHIAAFDEDALVNGSLQFLSSIAKMPDRRTVGQRIDWRDHGNLLGVHHVVQEGTTSGPRKWEHVYEVVFGNSLIFSLITDTRPIESVYGSPTELIVLSPLSTSPLKKYVYEGEQYVMKETLDVPKLLNAHWACICVAS
jgi:hypothetical protein